MQQISDLISALEHLVWNTGIPIGGEVVPFLVIALLGTGVFFTFRLGFIQLRHLAHGIAVTSGKYDDPNETGDVPHFQALTTALSATVGIGNIAGVAIAIHWGGPGALFWMWMTAVLGMAVKFSEVTLAQHFRVVEKGDGSAWGTVSGGPMYYIERGLGSKWKPLAVFFSGALMLTSFMTGNAVQANTVADVMADNVGLPVWITGLITASVVALVIVGGIGRIGKVTGILAPAMAVTYVAGALTIIFLNIGEVLPTFGLIFSEAFNPSAGVAGTGAGAFVLTMMWGVRRGLFSNEAGQGSAPIAHAAAKTSEPAREGIVGGIGPFIDTIVICTLTALVIITTVYDPATASEGISGIELTTRAFESTLSWSPIPLSIAAVLFAFSTMISWSYYGLKAFKYLAGQHWLVDTGFKLFYCSFIVLGSSVQLGALIDLSDALVFLVAIPNLLGLYFLAPVVRKEMLSYRERLKRGEFPSAF